MPYTAVSDNGIVHITIEYGGYTENKYVETPKEILDNPKFLNSFLLSLANSGP